jgi:hypothetical protein
MKWISTVVLIPFFLLLGTIISSGQSTLSAGDIAILGMNSVASGYDGDFVFVLMVDIEAGTEIFFTDDGWQEDSVKFRGHEGLFKYTAPSALTAGTVIIWKRDTGFTEVLGDTILVGTFDLDDAGDQVIAFQGTSASPSFIYAIQNNSDEWQIGDPTASNHSALPAGLTDGATAVAHGRGPDPDDNRSFIRYDGALSFSSPSEALAAFSDDTNWIGDSNTPYDFASIFGTDITLPILLSSFTVSSGNNRVTLRWVTESEIQNVGFVILRSNDKYNGYEVRDSYQNNPALQGQFNSSHTTQYSYTDPLVSNDRTYWYKLVDVDVNGISMHHGPISATPHAMGVEITTISNMTPNNFELYQNFPNPFNPSTTIRFDIPGSSQPGNEINIAIFNTSGQLVKMLYRGHLAKGTHQLSWNGDSDSGILAPSGMYYAMINTGYLRDTIKMLLIK